jgi:Zn-dependent protease
MGLADLTLQAIAFRLLALVIMASVHGLVVAGTAILLGDKGPEYDGRLTISPASHIDLLGTISLVLSGLGWSKPVAIDAQLLRIGRVGIVLVILAGCLGLLVTAALLDALILPALTMLPYSAGLTAAAFLREAGSLSIWFALLSLVPIPPLTGGLLLDAFGIRIPRQARWILAAALLLAAVTGVIGQLLAPAHAALASVILGQ